MMDVEWQGIRLGSEPGIGARWDDLGWARFDLGAHEIEEVEANLILLARKGLSPLHKITPRIDIHIPT